MYMCINLRCAFRAVQAKYFQVKMECSIVNFVFVFFGTQFLSTISCSYFWSMAKAIVFFAFVFF